MHFYFVDQEVLVKQLVQESLLKQLTVQMLVKTEKLVTNVKAVFLLKKEQV